MAQIPNFIDQTPQLLLCQQAPVRAASIFFAVIVCHTMAIITPNYPISLITVSIPLLLFILLLSLAKACQIACTSTELPNQVLFVVSQWFISTPLLVLCLAQLTALSLNVALQNIPSSAFLLAIGGDYLRVATIQG